MAREMKDSGIAWIGEIPTSWETDRLQWHLNEINIFNNPIQTEEVLSLTIEAGVIPYAEKGNQGNKAKEDYSQYKIAFPDTLVINSMNVIIGAVGISQYYGCVSPVYYVFRVSEDTSLRYIYYLFTNVGFQKEMRKYAKGILEIRLRISVSDMLRLRIPNPSYFEQSLIASFLDRRCAVIDRIIEQTKVTIDEYKKLKQSIITEAVIQGVRGPRKMKDSGVEWIGEIPEDWRIEKIKAAIISVKSGVSVNAAQYAAEEGKVGVLKTSCVSRFRFVPTENKAVNEEELYRVSCPVRADTLIMSRMNTPDLVGACGYVECDYPNLYLPDRLWEIRFADGYTAKYMWYYLNSVNIRSYYGSLAVGTSSSMQNITQDQLCNTIAVIPKIEEQREIVRWLDHHCTEIDRLIDSKQQLLTELEAYKKSVIYEYVTGKREVPQ